MVHASIILKRLDSDDTLIYLFVLSRSLVVAVQVLCRMFSNSLVTSTLYSDYSYNSNIHPSITQRIIIITTISQTCVTCTQTSPLPCYPNGADDTRHTASLALYNPYYARKSVFVIPKIIDAHRLCEQALANHQKKRKRKILHHGILYIYSEPRTAGATSPWKLGQTIYARAVAIFFPNFRLLLS